MSAVPQLRIGELSRRTGVSPALLRAWEARYGLLQPARTPRGYRLYSGPDEQRVARMRAHLAAGLSAAEAARLARAEQAEAAAGPAVSPSALAARLRDALDRYDDAAAHAALDALLATMTLESAGREVLLPYLRELGERWSRGEVSVAQEHFASALVQARLLGLARDWSRGPGPRAVLACAPEEHHELALILFGLALRARAWRITYLGANTPVATIRDAAAAPPAALVVVTAAVPERLLAAAPEVRRLGRELPVRLAGAGATPDAARRCSCPTLEGDPFAAAAQVGA